jgi:hypothetical protein
MQSISFLLALAFAILFFNLGFLGVILLNLTFQSEVKFVNPFSQTNMTARNKKILTASTALCFLHNFDLACPIIQ